MLGFAVSASVLFVFVLCVYQDTRTPMDTRLLYRYRVKDTSILRRIIPFKDKPHYPCCYFKVVPIYVYLCIALIGWILWAIDAFGKGVLSEILTQNVILLATIVNLGVYILYFVSLTIWWAVVDHKLMKTEQEKSRTKSTKNRRR